MEISPELIKHHPLKQNLILFLQHPENLFKRVFYLLKNAGVLLISTPNPVYAGKERYDLDETHISIKGIGEWKGLLKDLGFRVFAPFDFTALRLRRLTTLFDRNLLTSALWRLFYSLLYHNIYCFSSQGSPLVSDLFIMAIKP